MSDRPSIPELVDVASQNAARQLEAMLETQRHLEDAAAALTRSIRCQTDVCASLHGITAAARGPDDPPPDPLHPHRKKEDSARKFIALTLAITGVGACLWAAMPRERPTPPAAPAAARPIDGLAAMRAGDYETAAAAFERAGDRPRLAECLYYAERDDEALAVCDDLGDTGRAAYVRGLVNLRRGETALADADFRRAAAMGEWQALTLVSED